MLSSLSNIKIDEKGVKNLKKNTKKKKGFTLVELIAVIAILGILAAVIVPKVTGYTTQATDAAIKADSNTILNAVESYNAGTTGAAIPDTTTVTALISDATATTHSIITDAKAGADLIATLKRVDTSKDSTIMNMTLSQLQ
jgi:prepilin-type N-terminal cleavage/methylation domain-containing protein